MTIGYYIQEKKNNTGFLLLLIYLFFEYARPHDFFTVLKPLHIGTVLIVLLALRLHSMNALKFDSKQSKLLLALLCICAVHVPLAVNNYWAFQTTKDLLFYLVIFLSITTYINTTEKISRFINVWIIINVACALIGLKQGGKVPSSSFMGDENDFALVMNIAIPFVYFLFLQTGSKRKKIYYLIAIILFLAGNIASLSRGGFVGMAAVILYCWYKSPKKLASSIVVLFLIGSFCVTVNLIAPAKSKERPSYWEEIKSINEQNVKTGTGEERIYSWKVGWRIFLHNPIIGVGPGNYAWNASRYEPKDGLKTKSIAGRAAHSLYFTLIPELGLLGIMLFGGILYNTYKNGKWVSDTEKRLNALPYKDKQLLNDKNQLIIQQVNKLKSILQGVHAAIFGYLVTGVFLSVLYYPHFWILTALSITVKSSLQRLTIGLQNESHPNNFSSQTT